MLKHAALLAAALTACSPRPVVVRSIPEDSRVRVFYDLVGAVDVADDQVYDVRYYGQPDRMAVVDLPAAERSAPPLLSVEARRFDGCLVASAAASAWEVTLQPVVDCGRITPTPPTAPPQVVDVKPEPPKDTDGDGVHDGADLCPDTAAGATPSPTRLGCPDGDADGDGVVDGLDACPATPAGKYPRPDSAGCPQADKDQDGVGDLADRCPAVSAGPLPSASRLGCPAPVDMVIPLGPPSLSGSVVASSDGYKASADFDFAKTKPVDGVVDWPMTLPPEAATASSISVSFDLAASLAWAPFSASCFMAYYVVGPGAASACVVPSVRYGMVVDGVEALGGQGAVPAIDAKRLGNYAATATSKLALRLSLRGDVVASGVKATARIRMSW